MTSPVTSEDMAEDEDYIVIGGLGGSDQFLRSLIATVQFQIDPVHRVDKTLGPIQASLEMRFVRFVRLGGAGRGVFLRAYQVVSTWVGVCV